MITRYRSSRPGTVRHPLGLGAAALGAVAAIVLAGCSSLEYRENVCGAKEYPALSVNGAGSACFSDGEQLPAGYARYPDGMVPQQVDDKWDVYWRTRTLDENGKIIPAPEID